MDIYINSPNTEDILLKLKECKNFFEVQNLINNTFPGLILNTTEEYSDDYRYLDNNWKKLCNNMGVKQQMIIIVDFIPLITSEYTLLNKFYDTIVRNGFLSRRKEELILCNVCNKALLSKDLYLLMKHKGDKRLPIAWSKRCKDCVKCY